MGITLQESNVKSFLQEMNPEIHFDMGACLGLWHPYMQFRQNIFYRGGSVGAMDRNVLPEVPIWSMKRDLVRVPAEQVKIHEIAVYGTKGVAITCQKCKHTWQQGNTTPTVVCPDESACGNFGLVTDSSLFTASEIPDGTAWVYREVRDRVILVGWRHTFNRLLKAKIPGVTQKKLEEKFGIDLWPKPVDPLEIDEAQEDSFLDQSLVVSA